MIMFSNKYRLRETKKIAQVFKTGKHIHGKYIFIKYTVSKETSPRVAISVSTKLFKKAVDRNRIKRLIREAIKPHLTTLPNLDILIIVKKEIDENISLTELKKDTVNIFNKLISPKY